MPTGPSFEPLMALIGPTGRPVAMRMGPKNKKAQLTQREARDSLGI